MRWAACEGQPSSRSGRKDSSRCRSSRTSAASGTSEQIQAAESEKERYANARRPECFLSILEMAKIASVQTVNFATAIGESLRLAAADIAGRPLPHLFILVTD